MYLSCSLPAGEEGVPESPPTLAQFKGQVDSYETVYGEVEKFEVRALLISMIIDEVIQVSPVKQDQRNTRLPAIENKNISVARLPLNKIIHSSMIKPFSSLN